MMRELGALGCWLRRAGAPQPGGVPQSAGSSASAGLCPGSNYTRGSRKECPGGRASSFTGFCTSLYMRKVLERGVKPELVKLQSWKDWL